MEHEDGTTTLRAPTDDEINAEYYGLRPVNGFKLYEDVDSVAEANQLQYVCRQLRRETRKLTLQYNDIVFIKRDRMDPPAPTQFARWLRFCPSPFKSQVRTVILKSAYREEFSTPWTRETAHEERMQHWSTLKALLTAPEHCFSIIADFCEVYGNAVVKHHVEFVQHDAWDTVWHRGLQAMGYFKKDVARHVYGSEASGLYWQLIEPAQSLGRYVDMRITCCANYQIYPHDEQLDEEWMKREIKLDRVTTNGDLRYVEGGVQTWEREMRRWYHHGF